VSIIRFSCPNCRQPFTTSANRAGSKGSCPGCGHPIEVPSPRQDPFDFDQSPNNDLVPSHRRRDESPGGLICSILSLVLGAIGVIFFPFFFCLAGLVLGVVGMVLCRSKGIAILGFTVSFIGLIVNIVLLMYMVVNHEL
jgi:hypothetical protein